MKDRDLVDRLCFRHFPEGFGKDFPGCFTLHDTPPPFDTLKRRIQNWELNAWKVIFRLSLPASVKDWLPVFFLTGFKAHADLFPVAFSFGQMFRQLIRAKESTGNGFKVWLEISGDIPAQHVG